LHMMALWHVGVQVGRGTVPRINFTIRTLSSSTQAAKLGADAGPSKQVSQWGKRRIVRRKEDQSIGAKGLLGEIRDAARARDWQGALHSFSLANRKTAQLYEGLLRAALDCRRYPEGLDIFGRMCEENCLPTARAYVHAIRLHAKLGQLERAEERWRQALEQGMPHALMPEAYLAIISACAEAGDVAGAVGHFERLDQHLDATPGQTHFGAVLHACAKARHGSIALRFLSEMRARYLPRDAVAYTSCMTALRGSPLSDVTELARLMVKDRVNPHEHLVEAHLGAVLGMCPETFAENQMHGDLDRARLNAAAVILRSAREQRVPLKASVRRAEDALARLGIVGVGGRRH